MLRTLLAVAVMLTVVAPPLVYRLVRGRDVRNFREVVPGRFYRSGQMTADGFERVVREHGIRTVISLRDTKDDDLPPPDAHEAEFCRAAGIAHHRLSPAAWSAADGTVPAARNVAEFLRILDDPATARPVLVHCFAGVHRTGAYCAVYRMEYDGWPAADAITEMRRMGTARNTFEDDVLDYLEGYAPRAVGRRADGR